MTFQIKISQFFNLSEPNNGNETNTDIFPRGILKSHIILIGRKILIFP